MKIGIQSGNTSVLPQQAESRPVREVKQSDIPAQRAKADTDARAKADPQFAPKDIEAITEHMNAAAKALQQSIKFEFTEHHRMVIKIVDANTSEVIREVPPESLVRAFEDIQKLMGLLLDKKI